MSMDSNAILYVKALDKKTKDMVRSLDFSEYYLEEWYEVGKFLCCEGCDLPYGRISFDKLMEELANTLQNKGLAFLVETCVEDVPSALTYYYLGEKIKQVSFSDNIMCFDDPVVLHNVCNTLDKSEIADIFNETGNEVESDIDFYYNHPEEIGWIMDGIDWTNIEDNKDMPLVANFIKKLNKAAGNCSYDKENFIPKLEWEEQGIAKFSDKERELLKNNPWGALEINAEDWVYEDEDDEDYD